MSVSSVSCKPKPYCQCWNKLVGPIPWVELNSCVCGEEHDVIEWKWKCQEETELSCVVINEDQQQVTFHPFYSSGTAAVRGDTPILPNCHYYWEIKMLTEAYGTDIMVGVGTDKVNMFNSQYTFTSFLGQDSESYGLSYRGVLHHNSIVTTKECGGFCRGTIVGVRVDMWAGTLEFYLNRKPQGISFYNLRRHKELFPMVSSTAAQSSIRLIYSASWKASLLVDAAKILAASMKVDHRSKLPPGLWHKLRSHFWLMLPTDGCISDEKEDSIRNKGAVKISRSLKLASAVNKLKRKLRYHNNGVFLENKNIPSDWIYFSEEIRKKLKQNNT